MSEQIEQCAAVADHAAESDEEWAIRYPDEAEKYNQRAHRARTIAAAIRNLIVRSGNKS